MTRHTHGPGDAPCGCCEGTEALTPETTANRPGLEALHYRAGTHATFLETMKAGLSSSRHPALGALTTRESDDPAIALLDAWATVGDVLTFYQERIANEGYLRTATERRSIQELARLVGYKLRPGVAASVYLAFTLDKDFEGEVPAGTRAQSVPGPDELPQAFETSEALPGRTAWNALKPRQTQPQAITLAQARELETLYLAGTETKLETGSLLLFVPQEGTATPVQRLVATVEVDREAGRTAVTLQPLTASQAMALFVAEIRQTIAHFTDPDVHPSGATAGEIVNMLFKFDEMLQGGVQGAVEELGEQVEAWRHDHQAMPASFTQLRPWLGDLVVALDDNLAHAPQPGEAAGETGSSPPPPSGGPTHSFTPPGSVLSIMERTDLLAGLIKPPSLQPANARRLRRSREAVFDARGDMALRLVANLYPRIKGRVYDAVDAAPPAGTSEALADVYALRLSAAPFGYNAGEEAHYNNEHEFIGTFEWLLSSEEQSDQIFLDNAYKEIVPGSWVVIQAGEGAPQSFTVTDVTIRPRKAYGVSTKTTRLQLSGDWWQPSPKLQITPLRMTAVYAVSEKLDLTEVPLSTEEAPLPVGGEQIVLDGLYDGLEAGRWLVVSGQRADLDPGTGDVEASELVMLAAVEQSFDPDLPGDTPHTRLTLANALAYTYRRDTVTIYGNVAHATHGETRQEVLGAGDGRQAFQSFTLKQSPLTHLAAPTAAGAASTLEVRVNDVRWPEVDGLVWLGPRDRGYVTKIADDDKVTITFGDGQHGTRLPTGPENVRAEYRVGIGRPGNVAARSISLLATRPLGVKEVINPLPASGGADREGPDQARQNAPLAVMALDRLVSVQDYADFCRTFAGIAKASAAHLSDGRWRVVHLTLAGADDIAIDPTSDLYRYLRQALHRLGDPFQAIEMEGRERMLLVIAARVRIKDDYEWESVEPQIRTALLDTFGFERRALGQNVVPGEVLSAIQAVPGVAYVDLDLLDAVSETEAADAEKLTRKLLRLAGQPLDEFDRFETPELGKDLQKGKLPRGVPRPVVVEMARVRDGEILPAQLAVLDGELPDTLILTELN